MQTQKFSPNLAVSILLIFILGVSIYASPHLNTPTATAWKMYVTRAFFVGTPLALTVWLLSVSLTLSEQGILYKSLFGSKQLTWQEVQTIKISSTQYRVSKVLPFVERVGFELSGGSLERNIARRTVKRLGWFTFSHAESTSSERNIKIFCGWRLNNPSTAILALQTKMFPILMARANLDYDLNREVSFGCVRLSQQGIRSTLMESVVSDLFNDRVSNSSSANVYVPCSDIVGYSVRRGRFYVDVLGTETIDNPVSEVANISVLMAFVAERQLMTMKTIST